MLSVICLATQTVYLLYIFKLKNKYYSTDNDTFTPGVSVIICAKNEIENLKKNLTLFLNQEHSTFEIIVVNDKSTDDSTSYLKKLALSYPNLKLIDIKETPQGWDSKKWALKKGVAESKHPYLLFSDADCYPKSKLWIKTLANCFQYSDLVIGYGEYEKRKGFLNSFIQYETYQTAIAMLGLAQKGINFMAVGRNFGVKKKIYLDFNWGKNQQKTGGDDDLFVSKLKIKPLVCLNKNGHTISYPKENLASYTKQKTRHIAVSNRYSSKAKMIIGLYNLSKFGFYTSLFILLLTNCTITIFIGLVLFNAFILFYNFVTSTRELNLKLLITRVLYLDIFYTLFLWFIGPYALVAKKIKWK